MNSHWFEHAIIKICVGAGSILVVLLIFNLIGYLRLVKDTFLVKDAVPVFKQDDRADDAEQ
jgi:hypothetical protein